MTTEDAGCSGTMTEDRCRADIPDNPKCAPNYHFGMLLGVEDFRAEQGYHTGRLRRHQRVLHGAGVAAGFPVTFDEPEIRVGPGHAVDALGRDLVLDAAQCVSLPRWWEAHREDDAFSDVAAPDDATIDLDVVACWCACLDSPVPAIAAPCAGDSSDIAYSRVCETVRLTLVRSPDAEPPEPAPFHLLRMWFEGVPPRTGGDGKPLARDQKLADDIIGLAALPPDERIERRAALLRDVLAWAVAEADPAPPEHEPDEPDGCLVLARLRGVHVKRDAKGWSATVGRIDLAVRRVLLPTSFLQHLIVADPASGPAAGPAVAPGGASIAADDVTLALVFDQALAPASVKKAAFEASEFVDGTGWKPFSPADPVYDASDAARPTVRMKLDRAPAGELVRVTVIGTGSAPLLGASFVPAGAVRADGDGRDVSTSILRG